MKYASLAAAAWLVASAALAHSPGSAVSAARTPTRATTGPVTASGLLLPPFCAGQVELCGEEATLSPSTLRFGILLNAPFNSQGCERRRDAIIVASFGDLAAANARMCQERANREAHAATSHPYTSAKSTGEGHERRRAHGRHPGLRGGWRPGRWRRP